MKNKLFIILLLLINTVLIAQFNTVGNTIFQNTQGDYINLGSNALPNNRIKFAVTDLRNQIGTDGGEILFHGSANDVNRSTDYITLQNYTGVNNEFGPSLCGIKNSGLNNPSLYILGSGSLASDVNTSAAIMRFDARISADPITGVVGASPTNRPLFLWASLNNNLMLMHANGNLGINTGTAALNDRLDVGGTARIRTLNAKNNTDRLVFADINGRLNSLNPGTITQFLRGDGTWSTLPTFSCTNLNFVPKVTSGNNFSCSQIFDNGSSVGINSTTGFTYSSLSNSLLGPILPPSSGTIVLQVNGVTRSTAFIATSDQKYKQDIFDIKEPLSIINKFNAKSYLWNDLAKKELAADNGRHIGFIAQDLIKFIPEIVIKDENNNLAVNYLEIIPILTEAIKEQQKQIEVYVNSIEKLKLEIENINKIINKDYISTSEKVIDKISLSQNSPNPFAEKTLIGYDIPMNSKNAEIIITNNLGSIVKKFRILNFGHGEYELYAENFNAGQYIYTLIVDDKIIESKKMSKF